MEIRPINAALLPIFLSPEKSAIRTSEIPTRNVSLACLGTLKTGPQKIARSIFLPEKNWQCRVLLAALAERNRQEVSEGVPGAAPVDEM